MELLLLLATQLFSCGVATWLAFATITFACCRTADLIGMLCGHLLIAVIIFVLDAQWIQEQLQAQDSSGPYDIDGAYYIGVFIRVLLINSSLMPLCLWAIYRRRLSARSEAPHPIPDQRTGNASNRHGLRRVKPAQQAPGTSSAYEPAS